MDTVERIFEIVDRKYSEQQDFADDLGVARSVISAWRRGKSKSYMNRLHQIATILDTTPEYLLSGVETMPNSEIASLGISSRATALVAALDRLNDEGQEKLLDYADDLVASGKYKKSGADQLGKEA